MPLLKSPFGPITATLPTLAALNGSVLCKFFRSDALCEAPARATAVCSAEQITVSGICCSGPGGSCAYLQRGRVRCENSVDGAEQLHVIVTNLDGQGLGLELEL
jgi:hypothetical protein